MERRTELDSQRIIGKWKIALVNYWIFMNLINLETLECHTAEVLFSEISDREVEIVIEKAETFI